MKPIKIKFLIIFCFFSLQYGFSQGFKNIEVSFGCAIQPQDRRLFDYPHRQDIIKNEKSSNDFEYLLSFTKNIVNKKIINFSAGLGYSQLISRFSRPYDENYFTGDATLLATYVSTYKIHSLVLSNSLLLNIINHDKDIFSLVLPVNLNFAINKSVTSGDSHENKFLFAFRSLEIYSGLRYQLGRLNMEVIYRVYNLQVIDPSIFGSFLFITPNPPFLTKKTETLNLSKIMIKVGYQF